MPMMSVAEMNAPRMKYKLFGLREKATVSEMSECYEYIDGFDCINQTITCTELPYLELERELLGNPVFMVDHWIENINARDVGTVVEKTLSCAYYCDEDDEVEQKRRVLSQYLYRWECADKRGCEQPRAFNPYEQMERINGLDNESLEAVYYITKCPNLTQKVYNLPRCPDELTLNRMILMLNRGASELVGKKLAATCEFEPEAFGRKLGSGIADMVTDDAMLEIKTCSDPDPTPTQWCQVMTYFVLAKRSVNVEHSIYADEKWWQDMVSKYERIRYVRIMNLREGKMYTMDMSRYGMEQLELFTRNVLGIPEDEPAFPNGCRFS